VPPLAIVPGLGLGPESWRATVAALGTQATVHVLPGYGVPLDPGPAPTPARLAERLVGRLTGPVTLVGHSASCQVVAHAARLAPDLVRRLVLVGPTTDPRARSWPGLGALWLRTAGHEDPRQLPQLVRQYRRTTLRSMLRTMDAARRDDLAATLTGVGCPVVLVRGAHDRIARADWLGGLAGAGPRAARVVVQLPAGAHMVPLTHPDLLASHLAPHLADR
jgi:pimeloyl-ACP methyl ester carboxylesterase